MENHPSENGTGSPHNSQRRGAADHLAAYRFKPGADWKGNPGGRPRHDTLDEGLRALFRREAADGHTFAEKFVEEVIDLALRGDSRLAKMLWERHDGRNPLPVHVSGPGGGPILVVDAEAQELARTHLAEWRKEQLALIEALDKAGAPE